MTLTLKQHLESLTRFSLPNDAETIKGLPNLYRYDINLAIKEFPVLESVFSEMKKHQGSYTHSSIDSRGAMLNPGWYPCIPGWHCDDFYRPTGKQPALSQVAELAPQKHMLFILGDNSRTEFLNDKEISLPSENELDLTKRNLYSYYDEIICNREMEFFKVDENTLYEFSPITFHRGTEATKSGWRWFLRCTFSNHRAPKNEIRNQIQIYLDPNKGW